MTVMGTNLTASPATPHLWHAHDSSIKDISTSIFRAAAIPRASAWLRLLPSVLRIKGLVSVTVRTGCRFRQLHASLPTTQTGLPSSMSCRPTECPQRQILLSLVRAFIVSSLSVRSASSGSNPIADRMSSGVAIIFLSVFVVLIVA